MYRYSSGENMFIMVDGRDVQVPRFRKSESVHALCLVHKVDGIAILDHSAKADFKLEYQGNVSDGISECAVAFADLLGVKAFHTQNYTFESEGVVHTAFIESHLGECKMVRIDDAAKPLSALYLGSLE